MKLKIKDIIKRMELNSKDRIKIMKLKNKRFKNKNSIKVLYRKQIAISTIRLSSWENIGIFSLSCMVG